MADVRVGGAWELLRVARGAATTPGEARERCEERTAAAVPGTVAAALMAAGRAAPGAAELDAWDWWVVGGLALEGPRRTVSVELDRLAAGSGVWLDGSRLATHENGFLPCRVRAELESGAHELAFSFPSILDAEVPARPRPRWKTGLADHQFLRWMRTPLLGRQPGWVRTPPPVGHVGSVRVVTEDPVVTVERLAARCAGAGGVVAVELALSAPAGPVTCSVGGVSTELAPVGTDRTRVAGEIVLDEVERWWPHTHGRPRRYGVEAVVDGAVVAIGHVGFRTVDLDRGDGGAVVRWNGVPVFARGAHWFPVDPAGWCEDGEAVRHRVERAVACGVNMLRVPGGTDYASEALAEACDAAGVMLWQDAMLAYLDPPDVEEFSATVCAEWAAVVRRLARRASLAVLCGGQELEEQPAMFGRPAAECRVPLAEEALAAVAAAEAPGVPYLTSSPTGGDPPFRLDEGVSHYFGVGTMGRDLSDLAASRVRFVSEGLAFACPPEPSALRSWFDSEEPSADDPDWRAAIHVETGSERNLESYTAGYADELLRPARDAGRGHELERERAVVATVMDAAACTWRDGRSRCAGMLAIGLADLRPGAGWGLLDAGADPKAAAFVLARAWAPRAILAVDDGLNGVRLVVVNDGPAPISGRLLVEVYGTHPVPSESVEVACRVPARGQVAVDTLSCFGAFRDVAGAYGFSGEPATALRASWHPDDPTGPAVAERVVMWRVPDADPGLSAALEPAGEGWEIAVSTAGPASWVALDLPGFDVADSWFHLPPGGTRRIAISPRVFPSPPVVGTRAARRPGPEAPIGSIRALNARVPIPIVGTPEFSARMR